MYILVYKYTYWDKHTLKWVRDTKKNTVGWFRSVNSIICKVWYGKEPYKNRAIFFSEKTSHNRSRASSCHPMICWVAYWIITRVCIHKYVCVYRRDSFRCHCSFQRNLQIPFTVAEAVQLGRGGNGDIRVGRRLLQLPTKNKRYTKTSHWPKSQPYTYSDVGRSADGWAFPKKKSWLIWMSRGYPHLQKNPTTEPYTYAPKSCVRVQESCMHAKEACTRAHEMCIHDKKTDRHVALGVQMQQFEEGRCSLLCHQYNIWIRICLGLCHMNVSRHT